MSKRCELTRDFMKSQYTLLEDVGKTPSDLQYYLVNNKGKNLSTLRSQMSDWRHGKVSIGVTSQSEIRAAVLKLIKGKV